MRKTGVREEQPTLVRTGRTDKLECVRERRKGGRAGARARARPCRGLKRKRGNERAEDG